MLIQKLKILSLVILLSFLFNACSQKEVVTVFKTKNICFKQSVFEKPNLDIYIANEDIETAKDFKKANDSAYFNYEQQVLRNNKRCERLEDGKN